MASVDSSIGYITGTITSPSEQQGQAQPGYSSSLIGYGAGNITAPGYTARDNSIIGYTSGKINMPHHPVVILTPSGLKNIPINMWNGTTFEPPL